MYLDDAPHSWKVRLEALLRAMSTGFRLLHSGFTHRPQSSSLLGLEF